MQVGPANLTDLETRLLTALQIMTVAQELRARRAEWILYDKEQDCGKRKAKAKEKA